MTTGLHEPLAASAANFAPRQPMAQSKFAVAASAVVHVVLVVCLGLISIVDHSPVETTGRFAASFQDEIEQLELVRCVPPLPPAEQIQSAQAGGQTSAFALVTLREPAAVFRQQRLTSSDYAGEQPAWNTADLSQHVAGIPATSAGVTAKLGTGHGDGNAAGDGTGHGFFGSQSSGRRFVFVLDCSRSMNHPHDSEAKTRFKRLKLELVKSVASMSVDQEFFLIFFNEGPITMPSSMPVAASSGAKQHYLAWMQTLKADGNTEPTAAMQLALRLQPDVIYFLTDGSFIHKTQADLLRLPFGRTSLHTFAFEEVFEGELINAFRLLIAGDREAARDAISSARGFRKAELAADSVLFMKRLAERHNGEFHLIPHHEQQSVMASQQ